MDDLNTVRSVVLNKQREISPEDYHNLERRLFESWVIEKLAESHCQQQNAASEFEALREELGEMRKEIKELQKVVAKLVKKAQK